MNMNFAESVRHAIRQRELDLAKVSAACQTPGTKPADQIGICRHDASPQAIITHTFPDLCPVSFCRWLGNRLLFWPDGSESRRRISFVSSRLGQRRDLKPWWFTALRTAAIRCDPQTECLVGVSGTAACAATVRASELFGIRRISIVVDSEDAVSEHTLAKWFEAAFESSLSADRSKLETTVFLSPELQSEPTSHHSGSAATGSLSDRALLIAAQRVHLLSASRRGRITPLVHRHLGDDDRKECAILALAGNVDTESAKARPAEFPVPSAVFEAGAVPWILSGLEPQLTSQDRLSADAGGPTVCASRLADGPLEMPAKWLCHWTRAAYGPWPGQPEDEFLDALLLGCDTADRSAFAALLHIVETACIQTSRLSRNTVSFTQVPLAEFRERRVYRSHRRKYDFEPWGIAVRRERLEALGAQPVTYIDVSTNSQTSSPFEQPSTDGHRRICWKEEQEWRLPQQLNLRDCQCDEIVVFTNSEQEATSLRMISRWPVVNVPGSQL